MTCPHCFQSVLPQNAFCPHCGARLAEADARTVVEASQDPTYGPLAHANLMRLRGDWEGARERVVHVMREFPNSGTAHSLMGDIYADQQMYADAAQWYRMAIELEPSNAADSRKLAEVEKRLRADEAGEDIEGGRAPAFSPYRVLAVVGIAFLVIAISLGFYVKLHSVPLVDLGPSWIRPSIPAPAVAPSGRTDGGPAVPGEFPAVPETPTGAIPPAVHTVRESALEAQIAGLNPQIEPHGLSISSVTIDPRTDEATITLDGSGIDGASSTWMAVLAADSASLASRALQADARLTSATVRVVMPLALRNGTAREVAFIGEMDRPAAGATAAPPAFTRRWWRSGLVPPAGLASTAP